MFEIRSAIDSLEWLALLRAKGVRVVDSYEEQLTELIQSRNPRKPLSGSELAEAKRLIVEADEPDGVWVHYPWRNEVVHTLNEQDFLELRLNRNREKISIKEQRELRTKTILVVGLSVGAAIAEVCCREGVGGSFRLADFDTLSLSNLNRLAGSIADIGLLKTELLRRRLLEFDPFVHVETVDAGAQEFNYTELVQGVDLVIEECDDLLQKVLLREEARRHRVPVIMETTDRGMLDVERYDLEPERPLFHGRLQGVRSESLRGLSTREKVPYVLRILGTEMSPRMGASLLEVKETLWTWPQLASHVALGASLVTHAARRILLRQKFPSGRVRIDLDKIEMLEAPLEFEVDPHVVENGHQMIAPPIHRQLDDRTMEWLAYAASLAPSAGNQQPWAIAVSGSSVEVSMSTARPTTFLDWQNRATLMGIGACIETVVEAAGSLGFTTKVTAAGAASFRVEVLAGDGELREGRLARLFARRTRRRQPPGQVTIPEDDVSRLQELTRDSHWISPSLLHGVGHGCALIDRWRLLHPLLHREFCEEIRWTHKDAVLTRTGLDIATLELSPRDEAGLRLLRASEVMDTARSLSLGTGLETLTREDFEGAGAAIVMQMLEAHENPFVELGQRLMRIWLLCTELNIDVRPYGASLIIERMEQSAYLSTAEEWERSLLTKAVDAFRSSVPKSKAITGVTLRLRKVAGPDLSNDAPRSLRIRRI